MDGPSTVFCVAVVAWTVVINPSSIPKLSLMILANGARQLVVHEALLDKQKHNIKESIISYLLFNLISDQR